MVPPVGLLSVCWGSSGSLQDVEPLSLKDPPCTQEQAGLLKLPHGKLVFQKDVLFQSLHTDMMC